MSELPFVPNGSKKGWKIKVNGELIKVDHLELVNENVGKLTYGWHQSFDGFVYEENGGGGSVITLFVIFEGELYIGLLQQKRDNMLSRLNMPGGMLKSGESHFETGRRELAEETGFDKVKRVFELDGMPGNPNRAYFVTDVAHGICFFGVEVLPSEVREIDPGEDWGGRRLAFNKDVVKPVSPLAEKILGCYFHRWHDITGEQDMFIGSGVARLLAHLTKTGRLLPLQFA